MRVLLGIARCLVDLDRFSEQVDPHLDMSSDHRLSRDVEKRQSLFQVFEDFPSLMYRDFWCAHFVPFC